MINSLVNIILHSSLISAVGYFNRLKNQSDPLSRQVAINMDSNTQVCKLMIEVFILWKNNDCTIDFNRIRDFINWWKELILHP